jgi:lipopolysaccharide/colanic/teichoic acid biosynthesis glycosyltransferase
MQCRMLGVTVNDIGNFIENETGRIQLEVVNPSWLVFAEGFDTGAFRTTTKRIFDILASGSLLVLATPIMAVDRDWRSCSNPDCARPILYRQERVGLGADGASM